MLKQRSIIAQLKFLLKIMQKYEIFMEQFVLTATQDILYTTFFENTFYISKICLLYVYTNYQFKSYTYIMHVKYTNFGLCIIYTYFRMPIFNIKKNNNIFSVFLANTNYIHKNVFLIFHKIYKYMGNFSCLASNFVSIVSKIEEMLIVLDMQ